MRLKRSLIVAIFSLLTSAHGRAEADRPAYANYLPTLATEFADLDVRDTQNQAVHSVVLSGELRALFHASSADLLLRQPSHQKRCLDDLLLAFSTLLNNTFFITLERYFKRIVEAFLKPLRRVVHNVDNLWITLSDDKAPVGPMTLRLTLSRTPQKLFLRC